MSTRPRGWWKIRAHRDRETAWRREQQRLLATAPAPQLVLDYLFGGVDVGRVAADDEIDDGDKEPDTGRDPVPRLHYWQRVTHVS